MLSHYGKNPHHFGPCSIRSEDGTFLGLAGGDVSVPEQQIYEIWYFVQRQYWGQKIATRSVRELMKIMSESGRVKAVKAEAVVENVPSWKFLESLNFVRKERLSGAHRKNGKVLDRYVYFKEMA